MRVRIRILVGLLVAGAVTAVVVLTQWDGLNYQIEPKDKNFSGEWTVYSKVDGRPILRTMYKNGKKEGKETSWYSLDPDAVNTEQEYRDGVLDGVCARYDSTPHSQPLLSGRFANGRPWSGTFLIKMAGEVITAPYAALDMNDVVWSAARYDNGIEVELGTVGPKGFEPSRRMAK